VKQIGLDLMGGVKYNYDRKCKEEAMARTGRPKVSDDPRMKKITLRVSNEELARYETYAQKHNLSKAEVLRKGFELLLETDEKNNP